MPLPDSIDSNASGLRIAEEATPGVLPGTPIWVPREPNGYQDFGGSITRVSRAPISATRQRKKGVASGVDASGGYGEDFTETNFLSLLQGFVVADAREKFTTLSITGTAQIVITGTTNVTKTFSAASGLDGFIVGALVNITGFAEAATNGVKEIATVAAAAITTVEAIGADEVSPPASAAIQTIGFASQASDFAVDASGALPKVTAAITDLTTLGIIPGEWIYWPTNAEGGFVNAANNGYVRVQSVIAGEMVFDKTDKVWVTEAAPAASVKVYMGTVLTNEATEALIKRRTYQLERTLGNDGDGTQSQLVTGAFPNEFSIAVATEDKIIADLSFVGLDVETRTGLVGLKAGTRPALTSEDAYNTSNDFSRIRMAPVDISTSLPLPLFAFGTEFNLTLNNNVTPNKAVSVFGAFSTNLGQFDIGGSAEVYFQSVAAIEAVRANQSVTLDYIFGKSGKGWAIDIPLLTLGDARPNIEPNQPIKLPLELEASEDTNNRSILFVHWPFLPAGATPT
jgi:hypothetical protein